MNNARDRDWLRALLFH